MAKNGKDTKHTIHIARRMHPKKIEKNARFTRFIGVKEI